jgi:hypothetical protein
LGYRPRKPCDYPVQRRRRRHTAQRSDIAFSLFGTKAGYEAGDTLSSIKVESEKASLTSPFTKLADYVKSMTYGTTGTSDGKLLVSRPNPLGPSFLSPCFEDFELKDLFLMIPLMIASM